MKTQTVTINFRDVKLEVEGYFTPEENEVMYYSDMSGHPGSPAEFDIISICLSVNNENIVELIDITELLDVSDYFEDIEELAIQEILK